MRTPFREILVQKIRSEGAIPFVDFAQAALYDPEHGYYRQLRKRTGADPGSDFQTNLAVRSVFSPLILEAVQTLLPGRDLADFAFTEIGAEPEMSLLEGFSEQPFRSVQVIRIGEPVPALEGLNVVFSNEWLDAQPFVRMVFRQGEWRESFVGIDKTGALCERLEAPASADARSLIDDLPATAPEGYRFDYAPAAEAALEPYLAGDWSGLFLTLDYGSSWEALTGSLPGGTARSYFRHRQVADLLAFPGEQDLTCNVCWDRIRSVLEGRGFAVGGPQRQEAFLLENAQSTIRSIVEGGETSDAAVNRSRLMQLLNPVHFGAAFQALWGIR